MRKLYKFYLVALAGIMLIAYSCVKDYDAVATLKTKTSRKTDPQIIEARKFFEENAVDLALPDMSYNPESGGNTKAIDFGNPIVPQWGRSRVIKDGDYIAVQTALEDGLKHVALKMTVSGADTLREATRWFSRLVVKKDRASGESEMFIFSVAPDATFFNDKTKSVSALNFSDFEGEYKGDYSGIVLVSNLDGQVVKGMRYANGKAVLRFNPRRSGDSHDHAHVHDSERFPVKGEVFRLCMNHLVPHSTKSGGEEGDDSPECILDEEDYSGDGFCEACNEFHNIGYCQICGDQPCTCWTCPGCWGLNGSHATNCSWVGAGIPDPEHPSIGGGGAKQTHLSYTGYQDNGWGLAYINGGKFSVAGLHANSSFAYQNVGGNWCIPMSLAFVGQLYGLNATGQNFVDAIQGRYGIILDNTGGIISVDMNSLAGAYFHIINSSMSYRQAIDNGYVIMVTLGGLTHGITVVGYNESNGNLIYNDPECSQLREIPETHVNSGHYKVIVGGLK